MRVRAAEHFCVQQVTHLHVVGEGRVTLGEPEPVDLAVALSYHRRHRDCRREHDSRSGQRCLDRLGALGADHGAGRVGQVLDDYRLHRLGLFAAKKRS